MLAGIGQLCIQSTLHRSPQSLAKALLRGNQVNPGLCTDSETEQSPRHQVPADGSEDAMGPTASERALGRAQAWRADRGGQAARSLAFRPLKSLLAQTESHPRGLRDNTSGKRPGKKKLFGEHRMLL